MHRICSRRKGGELEFERKFQNLEFFDDDDDDDDGDNNVDGDNSDNDDDELPTNEGATE